MRFIEENYEERGTTIPELIASAKKFADATEYIRVNSSNLEILRVTEEKNQYRFVTIDGELVKAVNEFYALEPQSTFKNKNEVDETLVRESLDPLGAGFLLRIKGEDEFFYVSPRAISSIMARAGLDGDQAYETCATRDLDLMRALYNKGLGLKSRCSYDKRRNAGNDYNVTLVLRKDDLIVGGKKETVRKLFFMHSGKYTPVPLTIVPEITTSLCDKDDFGTPEVKYWYADHGHMEICVTFPEAAEDIKKTYHLRDTLLPGIIVMSSDTGEETVNSKAVLFAGKSLNYLTLEESPRKHTGKIKEEELLADANELIFRNLTVLPELMAKLICTPVWKNEKTTRQKERTIDKLLSAVFKGTKIVPIIGKGREVKVRKALMDEINTDIPYTFYDVAMMAMTLADRMPDLKKDAAESLSKALAKAPYVLKELVEDEPAFLMP